MGVGNYPGRGIGFCWGGSWTGLVCIVSFSWINWILRRSSGWDDGINFLLVFSCKYGPG